MSGLGQQRYEVGHQGLYCLDRRDFNGSVFSRLQDSYFGFQAGPQLTKLSQAGFRLCHVSFGFAGIAQSETNLLIQFGTLSP